MLAVSTVIRGRIVRGLVRNVRYCVTATTSLNAARCRLMSTIAGDRTTPDESTRDAARGGKTVGDTSRVQMKTAGTVQTDISPDGRFVSLRVDGVDVGRFHALWLRHNCRCPACRQLFSGQKLTRPAELAQFYSMRWAEVDPDDRLVYIDWKEEEHRSEFPVSFLRHSVHTPAERRRVTSTPSGGVGWLPTVDFEEIFHPAGRLRWLQKIAEVGIVLLRGTSRSVYCTTVSFSCMQKSTILIGSLIHS